MPVHHPLWLVSVGDAASIRVNSAAMPKGVRRAGPCGTTLVTAFGSDLRSVDTLRRSRYALTQPDAFGAGASRDGLRSFDKASVHRLGNGFNARLDAAKPARIPGLPMADFLMV